MKKEEMMDAVALFVGILIWIILPPILGIIAGVVVYSFLAPTTCLERALSLLISIFISAVVMFGIYAILYIIEKVS